MNIEKARQAKKLIDSYDKIKHLYEWCKENIMDLQFTCYDVTDHNLSMQVPQELNNDILQCMERTKVGMENMIEDL